MKKDQSLILYTRLSLALIYIWFGILKFITGLSPAEDLASEAMSRLFHKTLSHDFSLKLLAGWEVFIGIGFLIGKPLKYWTRLALIHMLFTFTPLFLIPELCFTKIPFAFTLVGQYIMKNLIFVGALLWLEKTNK